ncbi:hypothetical protein C9414_12170 [Bacillus sp. Nf3]|nr:hypothetical protein C9414_12170 [Bacillus sp. Nf3]
MWVFLIFQNEEAATHNSPTKKASLKLFNEGLRKSIQNLAEMIGTKSKWSDIVRYICKYRVSN